MADEIVKYAKRHGRLIVAIVGAVWLTGFQGLILDYPSFLGLPSIRGSFYLTVTCFVIIAIYGWLCRHPRRQTVEKGEAIT